MLNYGKMYIMREIKKKRKKKTEAVRALCELR